MIQLGQKVMVLSPGDILPENIGDSIKIYLAGLKTQIQLMNTGKIK